MKTFLLLVLITASLNAQTFKRDKNHPFSGTIVLTASSGITLGNTDIEDGKIGFSGSGMLEYFIPTYSQSIFGIRLQFTGNNIKGRQTTDYPGYSTDIYSIGSGISYLYSIKDVAFPYLYGGFAFHNFFPNTPSGRTAPNREANVYRTSTFGYNFELGTRILIASDISLNLYMNYTFPQTDYLDDIAYLDNNDKYLTIGAGISFSLLGNDDSDGDGIKDNNDYCPNEKEDFDGFEDDDGCPDFDNDNDGILDAQDNCPNIPEDKDGFQDNDGCPEQDNDNDGILDEKDNCPNQPEDFDGFEDNDGCPDVDNDKDGILDNTDKCPNAAEDVDGFQDDDGCPDIDNDGDGILDKDDACPNSPETFNNYQDQDGCPDEVPVEPKSESRKKDQQLKQNRTNETKTNQPKTSAPGTTAGAAPKNVVLEGFLTFEDEEEDIKPQAYKELDQVADMIKKNPGKKFRVEGYVDKNDNDNADLGGKRAREVMLYLIKKGVPVNQLETVDMGDKYPRVKNDRPSGRALNRRVEIKPVK